jgi:hypothetical protein
LEFVATQATLGNLKQQSLFLVKNISETTENVLIFVNKNEQMGLQISKIK